MSKVVRSAVGLMIVTALAKVIGFIREIVLASVYGTSFITDSYLVATSIPNSIFAIIGIALSTTFIPIYCEIEKLDGYNKSNDFTNKVLNLCIIISTIIAFLGTIFIEPLVKVFAIGFTGQALRLTIELSRISIWAIILTSVSSVMKVYLNANNKFIISGLVGLPYNIIVIICIIISFRLNNEYILIYGFLIAILSQIFMQLPCIYKLKYKIKFDFKLNDKYIKKMMYLLGPVIIGVSVDQVNTIIDKTLASTLETGSISALNYSNKLILFIITLFITSISTVIYPILANLLSSNNKERFIESIMKIINCIIILIIPISIGSIALSKPIIQLLFERGAFDQQATEMTAVALIFYSIGMIGYALRDILGKVFYSLQDTKSPMINGVIAMILNMVLNLILVKFMGHSGLALATSISAIICILLLFKELKKKIGYFGQDNILKVTVKSLISATAMGVITYFVHYILSYILGIGLIENIVALFISILIAILVYITLVILLKIEEVNIILDMIKSKTNIKKSKA